MTIRANTAGACLGTKVSKSVRNSNNPLVFSDKQLEKNGLPHVIENDSRLSRVPAWQPSPLPGSVKCIVIDTQYLGSSLFDASQRYRVLLVKSPMGTGKTFAVKKILSEAGADANILLLSSRKKLLQSLASDLQLSYYEHVKNCGLKDDRKEMVKRLAITPQSLAGVLGEHSGLVYDYVVIDTPPIGIVSDTFNLTDLADLNLLVVRQNYTVKSVLKFFNDVTKKGLITNQAILLNDPTFLRLR